MTTYKLQLTEDEWFRALRGEKPNAIADGLHSQQPELYGRLLSREVIARQDLKAKSEADKAAREQAETEAAKQAESAEPKNEPPATAPATVEDAGPKAPVRKSGKQSDKP